MQQGSLLRWGIENSAPGALLTVGTDVKEGRRPDLNSAMLKHIMGVSPADRMVECCEVIQGRWIDPETGKDRAEEVTIEDKLKAWDDLENVSRFSCKFSSSYSSLIHCTFPHSSSKISIMPMVSQR